MALPFFGRKRKEEKQLPPEMPSLSSLDQLPPITSTSPVMQQSAMPQFPMPQPPAPPAYQPPEPKVERIPERPTAAPLFVKIDRYRQILGTIASLKSFLSTIKSSLATLDQVDKLRSDATDAIVQVVNKLDQKLTSLDNDLLRPAGYHDAGDSAEYRDVRGIEATVSDLHGQIEQLKSELNKMV